MLRDENVVKALRMRECNGGSRVQQCRDLKVRKMLGTLNTEKTACALSYVVKFAQGTLCPPHLLATAHEDGYVGLCFVNPWNAQDLHDVLSRVHRNVVYDIAWVPGSSNLLTGSGDETINVCDVMTGRPKVTRAYDVFGSSVRRLDVLPESPSIFAAACQSGIITIYDVRDRSQGPTNVIKNFLCSRQNRGHDPSGGVALKDICFISEKSLVSCAIPDGGLSFWDLRKLYSFAASRTHPVLYIPNPTKGIFQNVIVHPTGTYIYASNNATLGSCDDNLIYRFPIGSLQPDCKFSGAGIDSWSRLSLSPGGEFLSSGSSEEYGFVWQADVKPELIPKSDQNKLKPIALLGGTGSVVTSVAWSDGRHSLIVTSSETNERQIWALPNPWNQTDKDSETVEEKEPIMVLKTAVFRGSWPINPSDLAARLPKAKWPESTRKRRAPLSPKKLSSNSFTIAEGCIGESTSTLRSPASKGENTQWLLELQRKSSEKRKKVKHSKRHRGTKTLGCKSLLTYYNPSTIACQNATSNP